MELYIKSQQHRYTKASKMAISAASIDRLLTSSRTRYPRRLGGTKPGYLLKQHILIKVYQCNEKKPGFVEGDTVAHCGISLGCTVE